MNPFFEDFFRFPSFFEESNQDFTPRVNINETEKNVSLTFELPGMEKDDIKVMVQDNVLTVSGQREVKHEEKKDNYLRSEISSGSFSRSFTLPDTVDAGKINAEYKNGLLEVTLEKHEKALPKEIKVKVS
jgi:HSP20 family protein